MTGPSLPSNWGRKSAPFPMAKIDVFSQFHVEKFPIAFTYITLKAIQKIKFFKEREREHSIFKIAVNVKGNYFFSSFKRCAIFSQFPKMLIIFPILRAPGPCSKKGCDSPT